MCSRKGSDASQSCFARSHPGAWVTAKEEGIVAEQEHVRQAESKLHETRVRCLHMKH